MSQPSILFDEARFSSLEESQKPTFLYEWLQNLSKVLKNLTSSLQSAKPNLSHKEQEIQINDKELVRKHQKQLVAQLSTLIQTGGSVVGSIVRQLIADSFVGLFTVGDTFLLFETINKCNDLLKTRDDSLSSLSTRLSAIRVLGTMYEKLGRMTGRSFEETVGLLNKGWKNAESTTRAETMLALGKICTGLGSAASAMHRDLYKSAKAALSDRSLPVRAAAAQCLISLAANWNALYTSELDSVSQAVFRAFDGANASARRHLSQLMGTLLAYTQQPPTSCLPSAGGRSKAKATAKGPHDKQALISLEDALNVLLQGYVKGGSSGSGLMITKGGGTIGPDVRVGVALSYIAFATKLGGLWLERNLSVFLNHVISGLLSHPKAVTSHGDTVQSRRCVGSIVHLTVGQLLGEKAQLAACKELVNLINNHLGMASGGVSADSPAVVSLVEGHQHALVVALMELGHLMVRLGSVVAASLLVPSSGAPPGNEDEVAKPVTIGSTKLLEVLVSVLPHSSAAPRSAAAWCLRCMAIACPTHLTPAIDMCLEGLENLRSSPEAVIGYSSALAALLGAVRHTPLGIPHTRGKLVFNVGEELLRTASQNSRLSRERTQAGWLLIGSIMTLGSGVVKGLLPRMMLLWRNAFPRTAKELESEKARGDGFTWKISIEARAGALASMHSFLQNAPELVNEDIVRRITSPIEGALMLLGQAPTLLKSYANELRALLAMLRLRLFETLSLLPPNCLESNFAALLRLLVSEFTLADGQSGTSTSLLPSLCHPEDNILLLGSHNVMSPSSGMYSVVTRVSPLMPSSSLEVKSIAATSGDDSLEELLLPNSIMAIEHDLTSLYRPLREGRPQPGPMPLGIAVVDASIIVFGLVFPRAAVKHRAQMLEHFSQHLKVNQTQSQNARAEAINTNIYAAVLASLKGLVDVKAKTLGNDEVKRLAVGIISGGLVSTNTTTRCTAAECLGRLAQIICDPQFVAESATKSFECLKSARDVVSRTGHSVALGSLHRYVGGMGSTQHLQTSVSILMALAQDTASPQVQIWALHALTTIAESGGPMFRGFVEPALAMVLKSLLSMSSTTLEVHICLGKLLSALITAVGPELLDDSSSSVMSMRGAFTSCCAALGQPDNPSSLKAEAIAGLQQLHMFAPKAVDLANFVPILCQNLQSPHWALRKASVACLRQFAQREAATMCDIAQGLDTEEDEQTLELGTLTLNKQFGLPGLLFSLLDHEVDPSLTSDIHDTLNSMMHSTAVTNLSAWLSMCREVLSVATEDVLPVETVNVRDDEFEDASDDVEFKVGGNDKDKQSNIQPRWKTRVFAAICLRRIIEDCCQGNRAHFDLGLAREIQLTEKKGDFLVLHLSELIRVAFMAATSDSDPLRLEGLKTLEVIIERFGETQEPELPGHVILEQYQAQVGAALRPAFAADTPSHITAAACDVCSAWIGSGVARDLGDLRRVYQLLVTSLTKLRPKLNSQRHVIFNESALTLEKLSILKAWAEVYIVSMKNDIRIRTSFTTSLTDFKAAHTDKMDNDNNDDDEDDEFGDFEESTTSPSHNSKQEKDMGNRQKKDGLGSLVQSELPSLSKHWLNALRDHALLSLPSEFKSQLPFDGGAFYTHDTITLVRPHYRATWPPILHAAAVWLSYGQGFESSQDMFANEDTNKKSQDEINAEIFHLMLGVCVEGLANTRSGDLTKEQVMSCLRTLMAILDHDWVRRSLATGDEMSSRSVLVELCNVLHRTVLTRETVATQSQAMDVLKLVLISAKDVLEVAKKNKGRELGVPVNQLAGDHHDQLSLLGEGSSDGVLVPGKSVAFAALEVCLCVLVRHYPELSPRAANLSSAAALRARAGHHRGLQGHKNLVSRAVELLSRLPALCSPEGSLSILPSILWLLIGVIKAAGDGDDSMASVQSLKHLIQYQQYPSNEKCRIKWTSLQQSALQRLLDLAKTSDGGNGDDINILSAIAVFLLHSPVTVISEAPGLKYPAVNAFVRAFQQQSDSEAKRRVVQAASSVLASADRGIAQPLAQAIAPPVMDYLLVDEASRSAKCQADLSLTLESIYLVEVLMSSPNLAPISGDDKRLAQLSIFLIPILVSHLLAPEEIKEASKLRLALHEHALAKLTSVGQSMPTQFKSVMGQNETLRGRLEAAVKANQERLKASSNQKTVESNKIVQPAAPTIKLTMDFGKKYAS